MQSHDGKTLSCWWSGVDVPTFGPLVSDESCEICVIGAGIAGLSVAHALRKAGKRVIVIDDSGIGDGQTGRTSAHLASAWDDRFVVARKLIGADKTRLLYESHARAIDSIENISREESIDCDFERVNGWLFLGPDDDRSLLDSELEAAQNAGFLHAQMPNVLPLPKLSNGPAIRFPNQARFHPMKYLVGLANAITKHGGQIYCGDRVIDVQGVDPKNNAPATATTLLGRTITASEAIVVCTNVPSPINDWLGIYLKQAAYRTYVVAFKVQKDSLPRDLFWDTSDPYHYVRTQSMGDHDLLLVGGEDHKTGQRASGAPDPFAALEQWVRTRFEDLGHAEFRWSGQVQEPDDGVAFIGMAPHKKEAVYVCTGDSGMGLTHGAIAGLLIPDLILRGSNEWIDLYDPARKPIGAVSEFVRENVNAGVTMLKHLSPGEVSDVKAIASGEGAVMRAGTTKVAVHRDADGTIHACSAICTHLGCVVEWNSTEKTWDCPCHGARFDATGRVIMGPAIDDLSLVEPPASAS